ncbi:MAG TPA: hypothetical protein VGE26_10490 [Sphingobacteriaceae bacterium]
MKNESTLKLTERYDLELLSLLTEDLRASRPGNGIVVPNTIFNYIAS